MSRTSAAVDCSRETQSFILVKNIFLFFSSWCGDIVVAYYLIRTARFTIYNWPVTTQSTACTRR